MSQHSHPTGPVIRTRGLTKAFTRRKQTIEAVRGLDLEVAPGELVAFLGPNGAGKSTTLRMLTTLIPPTSGSAEVAGFDVVARRRDVRRVLGYVGQGNAAGHQQRGRDELVSQGRAHGMSRRESRRRAEELIEMFDLAEHAARPVSTLSGGQRRRLDVAIGLVHTPRLLFLDEPSTGLDPQNRANLQEQIRRLHSEHGTTIVLTTHYLEEADAIADRVVVIDHGRVIADDTAARLKSGLGDLVRLGFEAEGHARLAAERAAARLSAQASIERAGSVVTIRTPGGADLAPHLVQDLGGAGAPVRRIEVVGPTLDDVFLHLTGRSLRETNETNETDETTGETTHPTSTTQGAAA
jgi:ABC-2 type transport system ATP-binding protein